MMLFETIDQALVELEKGNERRALGLLYNNKNRFRPIENFLETVNDIYYSCDCDEETQIRNLKRYLRAASEYLKCLEVKQVAYDHLKSVTDVILKTDYYL